MRILRKRVGEQRTRASCQDVYKTLNEEELEYWKVDLEYSQWLGRNLAQRPSTSTRRPRKRKIKPIHRRKVLFVKESASNSEVSSSNQKLSLVIPIWNFVGKPRWVDDKFWVWMTVLYWNQFSSVYALWWLNDGGINCTFHLFGEQVLSDEELVWFFLPRLSCTGFQCLSSCLFRVL